MCLDNNLLAYIDVVSEYFRIRNMKLVPILASIVTGFAMLATVGSTSASALVFDLSGTFSPTDFGGSTGVAGGSFNGTYSYSGGVVPAGGSVPILTFSINVLNSSNVPVYTFSSNDSNTVGYLTNYSSPADYDILDFESSNAYIHNTLAFQLPQDFQGTGNIAGTNSNSDIGVSSINSYLATFNAGSGNLYITYVASGTSTSTSTSTPVPEPSTIAGMVLGGAGLMAARFKYKKQKASQAA